ncbi:putative gpi anchored protein [Rosellinia necatrix]|uniref:Putative gpi anchored protein n=1 Tax=Rosellinia necatrix TaxID=77044 RepID=A0A1S7UMK5_ROSNE|nr:putative gpi anchored protein [Rosellinia necatrix]
MRVPQGFLSLPPALLLLLAAQLHAQAGSGNGGDGLQALPTAVRKMSLDEGEKFMPEYYAFAPADLYGGAAQAPLKLLAREADVVVIATPEEEALLAANGSAALAFRPPFPRHYDYRGRDDGGSRVSSSLLSSSDEEPQSLYRRTAGALARLQGREFTCPGGTHVCSNIDQPNYCCTDGTTCFVVENAPDAGNVGCCPKGQTCGGSVAACADGNTACPAEDGGGCCISGFVCADVGCVKSTVTVITPTTSMAATTTSQAPPPTSTTTPPTTSRPPSTTTPEPVTSTYNSGSGSGSGTGLPPVRPTSSGPETNPGGATTTAGAGDYCPTGFYACVASAGSGCCRTGRDCSTTSCPPPAASTTIITHGATIVVPLTDALAAASTRPATATCAGGWFLCGADAGPVSGCCPTGYLCGTASCTLSAATATATVQKERPGNAAAGRAAARGQGRVLLACVALCWAMFF